jgi:IclR family acetate operon transcriptional repressor
MFTQIGARVPLHCSGVGKAMLAYMPDARVQQLLGDKALPAFTVNTITNLLRMRQELARVRECGYAVDDEEREEGVRCVSAPIFQADGSVRAACSISGPSGRFPHSRLNELGLLVREAGLQISANLGYRPQAE